MNENQFGRRLKDAIGEPPRMASPVLSDAPAGPSRPQPRFLAILAFALAVLMVLVFAAARAALHPTANISPAGRSNTGPSPAPQAALDSFPCALPVTADIEAGNAGQPGIVTRIAGFINIPSGVFRSDPAAGTDSLPGGSSGPTHYSTTLKRWLPASARYVSPDERSYAYVTLLPTGATYSTFSAADLHVYDVANSTDRKLWNYAGSIDVVAWNAAGILVDTVPPRGGVRRRWLIDPTSGTASQQPATTDPVLLSPAAIPSGYHGYSYSGGDGSGRGLVRFGARDPGTKYIVALDDNGTLTTIYTGVAGDAKDFDPEGMSSDAHGVWMTNYDGKYVWLWSASAGLRSFAMSGGVPAPSGYQFTSITYTPAGSCSPGSFTGTDASPLPAATTPSPPPSPPVVDWAQLQSRALQLSQLPAGGSCPVSSSVDLSVKAQSGKWPNYGFGPGPAYITGQATWYSGGPQAMLVLVDPKYQGPLLIRIARLDGTGSGALSGDGLQALANGSFGLPQTSSPPYWGTWIGSITPSAAGCYGIQLDGTSFTAVIYIEVKNGPPPPG